MEIKIDFEEILSPQGVQGTASRPKDFVMLDLETTGFSHKMHEIIEVGLLRVRDMEITDTYSTLVRPEAMPNAKITEITGITHAMLEEAPPLSEVIHIVHEFIGCDILLAHNAGFDISFIRAAFEKFDIPFTNSYINTIPIFRSAYPELENYKLQTVVDSLLATPQDSHRAINDCINTFECYKLALMQPQKQFIAKSDCKKESHSHPVISKETKELRELDTLFDDILSDSTVSEEEVYALNSWLQAHSHLVGNFPYDDICLILSKYLEDGKMDSAELAALVDDLHALYNPLPCSSGEIRIDVSGKTVCLSGDFACMQKKAVAEALTKIGCTIKNCVTQGTDFLIVGSKGSDKWQHQNYGSKIKKALEMQKAGFGIQIVNETEVYIPLEG